MEGEHTAYVLRLLRNEDVSADLRDKSLYCLWTDYGNTWYRSVVEKCDPASGTASLYVSGCLGVWVSGCLGVWVSGCLGVWVSGCLDVWMSGYLLCCAVDRCLLGRVAG